MFGDGCPGICIRWWNAHYGSGTAAGVDNPTAVQITDLALISTADADDVLRRTRGRLVRDFGFKAPPADAAAAAAEWGVPTVYVPNGRGVSSYPIFVC